MRIAQETTWRIEKEWLRRSRNTQSLPSFLERRFELYIPVQASSQTRQRQQEQFILEK